MVRTAGLALSAPHWPRFFAIIRKTIRAFPIPYVTRLAGRFKTQEQNRAFAVLVATLISLRTKDKVTEEASERLLMLAPDVSTLSQMPPDKIAKAIYPCGFYKTKSSQLATIAATLLAKHGGKVPRDLDQLIALPGVGRKTANLVLTEGFDSDGICVDTHVHRILNRLGFIATKTPDDTEMALRKILPKKYWKKINLWLVMFGQYHCKPIGPNCEECQLNQTCAHARRK